MTSTRPAMPLLVVPELGPHLGRLVVPAPGAPASESILLDDLRHELVTQVFELAGEAREWASNDESDLALAALGRAGWLAAWERAVRTVAERAGKELTTRLLAAAEEARLPRRRRAQLPVTPAEVQLLATRLARGGALLLEAVDVLEVCAANLRGSGVRHSAARAAWEQALTAVARRLEAAWMELEVVLAEEWRGWQGEIGQVRDWRRPRWPLWALGLTLFGLATWFGLMLGGFVPVPAPLQPLAALWWEKL